MKDQRLFLPQLRFKILSEYFVRVIENMKIIYKWGFIVSRGQFLDRSKAVSELWFNCDIYPLGLVHKWLLLVFMGQFLDRSKEVSELWFKCDDYVLNYAQQVVTASF